MSSRGLMGIGIFQSIVLHLISIGKQEDIQTIEKCMEDGNLIEYLFAKYQKHFYVPFDNHLYDNAAINKYFQKYCGYIEGNESRKYGIMNETDGLLLILSLISDKIEEVSATWEVD